jgi:hypothetical protein
MGGCGGEREREGQGGQRSYKGTFNSNYYLLPLPLLYPQRSTWSPAPAERRLGAPGGVEILRGIRTRGQGCLLCWKRSPPAPDAEQLAPLARDARRGGKSARERARRQRNVPPQPPRGPGFTAETASWRVLPSTRPCQSATPPTPNRSPLVSFRRDEEVEETASPWRALAPARGRERVYMQPYARTEGRPRGTLASGETAMDTVCASKGSCPSRPKGRLAKQTRTMWETFRALPA